MLTKKQLDLLAFIDRRVQRDGVPPSFDEMKEALDLRSKSVIHRLITALEERGFIRRLPHRARALEIIRMPDALTERSGQRGGFTPRVIEGDRPPEGPRGVARAESGLRPTVTTSAQVRIDQDLNETAGASLQFSGPVYQGGRLASVVRQAMARRDATRAGLLNVARQVEQNVANAYASVDVARASRESFETQVRAATAAFNGVREEATLGARTTLDVLDAEQTLLNARADLISAEVDQTTASYSLLSAMGLMTAQNLGLAVQVYDPTAYYNLVDDAPSATSERGVALDRVLRALDR